MLSRRCVRVGVTLLLIRWCQAGQLRVQEHRDPRNAFTGSVGFFFELRDFYDDSLQAQFEWLDWMRGSLPLLLSIA
jgi:hypothetical protein